MKPESQWFSFFQDSLAEFSLKILANIASKAFNQAVVSARCRLGSDNGKRSNGSFKV